MITILQENRRKSDSPGYDDLGSRASPSNLTTSSARTALGRKAIHRAIAGTGLADHRPDRAAAWYLLGCEWRTAKRDPKRVLYVDEDIRLLEITAAPRALFIDENRNLILPVVSRTRIVVPNNRTVIIPKPIN